MRIIFIKVHAPYTVCSEHDWGKREYRERWLVRQAKRLGHDASMFLLGERQDRAWSLNDEVEVKFFPVDDKSVSKQKLTSVKMLDGIRRENPDLLIFKGLDYKLSTWLIEELEEKIPFAFIVGGNVKDKYLKKASYVLAETEEQIKESFSKLDQNRVAVLPKSIDLSVFKPTDTQYYDVCNVGSFEHRKNQQLLTPLFKKYRVAFVGDGPDWLKFKSNVKQSNVLFYGNQPTNSVAQIIANSKVMAHSSIWEGFPRTIIESFACETPVVALSSTITGIVENGVNGYLVKEEEFVDTVKKLLKDEKLIKKMGENGRKLAIEKYGKESTIPVLEKMFKTIWS